MSNLSKALNKLIEKNGVYEASKMVGLKISELVRKTEYPINAEIADAILYELVPKHKEMRHYKDMKLDYDNFSGALYIEYDGGWDGKHESVSAIATPFWNGEPSIPVDTNYYVLMTDSRGVIVEDDTERFTEIKTRAEFDSVEDLLTWYKHFYLPKVYNVIVNDHLPKIREKLKSEIDEFEKSNDEELTEKWSLKYKRSIDCKHPKGFSQRAHCQGRKKK